MVMSSRRWRRRKDTARRPHRHRPVRVRRDEYRLANLPRRDLFGVLPNFRLYRLLADGWIHCTTGRSKTSSRTERRGCAQRQPRGRQCSPARRSQASDPTACEGRPMISFVKDRDASSATLRPISSASWAWRRRRTWRVLSVPADDSYVVVGEQPGAACMRYTAACAGSCRRRRAGRPAAWRPRP